MRARAGAGRDGLIARVALRRAAGWHSTGKPMDHPFRFARRDIGVTGSDEVAGMTGQVRQVLLFTRVYGAPRR